MNTNEHYIETADFTEDRKKDEERRTTKVNNIEDPDPSGNQLQGLPLYSPKFCAHYFCSRPKE